jgi:hypothetical protein
MIGQGPVVRVRGIDKPGFRDDFLIDETRIDSGRGLGVAVEPVAPLKPKKIARMAKQGQADYELLTSQVFDGQRLTR